MEPIVGKTYEVTHSRKGTFNLRVTGMDDEWVNGTIVAGSAEFFTEENREAGEVITLRRSLCIFRSVPDDAAK